MRDIKALVIPPAGKVYVQFIQPADAAISKIIFGHDLGQVGEFGFGNTLMMVDECAGDNPATTIPNLRATELWNTLSGKHGELDPFENPVLSTVVMVGRDIDGNYTDVQEDVMTYKFKEGAPVATDRAGKRRRLEAAKALLGSLEAEIKDLEEEVGRTFPEPSGERWSVTVKFSSRGTRYEYLLLRVPGGAWYTTGRGDDDKFENWDALVDWLEGPDVHSHSSLRRLRLTGEEYEFPLGEVVMTANGEDPF